MEQVVFADVESGRAPVQVWESPAAAAGVPGVVVVVAAAAAAEQPEATVVRRHCAAAAYAAAATDAAEVETVHAAAVAGAGVEPGAWRNAVHVGHAGPDVVAAEQHSWSLGGRLGGAVEEAAAAAAAAALEALWYSGSPFADHCGATCRPGGSPGGLVGYTMDC